MAIRHTARIDTLRDHHRERLVMLREAIEPCVQAEVRGDVGDRPAVRMARIIEREYQTWGKVVREANIQAQ